MAEDGGQLAGEALDLLVGQVEPGEDGHLGHIVSRERGWLAHAEAMRSTNATDWASMSSASWSRVATW